MTQLEGIEMCDTQLHKGYHVNSKTQVEALIDIRLQLMDSVVYKIHSLYFVL